MIEIKPISDDGIRKIEDAIRTLGDAFPLRLEILQLIERSRLVEEAANERATELEWSHKSLDAALEDLKKAEAENAAWRAAAGEIVQRLKRDLEQK